MTASRNGPHSTHRDRERTDNNQDREWRADIGTSGAPPWNGDTGGWVEVLSSRQPGMLKAPLGRGPKLLPQEGKPRAFVNPNPGRNRLGRRATVSRNAGGRSTAAAPSAILRTMRSSWLTRLKVVVLATVVLSGGSGLPMLDALLYHTGGSRGVSQTGTHWEMPGSPDHHADRCTLGRAAPVPRPEPISGAQPRFIAFTFQHPALPLSAAPRSAEPCSPLHSRAPPALGG